MPVVVITANKVAIGLGNTRRVHGAEDTEGISETLRSIGTQSTPSRRETRQAQKLYDECVRPLTERES